MRNAIVVFFFSLCFAFSAFGAEEKIGEVKTTGLIVKDRIEVHVFDDPTIEGVACYVTIPVRTMSFEDPTDSSIACRQVGPIKGNLTTMDNVFKNSKSLFFKTQHVDRMYDPKRKVLIYLTYTTKTSGNNASHSISVVPVGGQ